MSSMLVRNVRPMGQQTVDLLICNGRFEKIETDIHATNDPSQEIIDGGGRLLFPGLIDAHAHMDKSLLGLPWYRNAVGSALTDKIDNERNLRQQRGIDFHQQTLNVARRYIADGTTHIRSFVDIDTDNGLSGFDGLMRTKDALKDALSIQVCAFPQSGMLCRPGTVDLMRHALQNGATVVGGLDPSSIDRDPAGHLDTIFELAEKYDVDIDIHLHEPGDLGAFSMELICERTKALGWQGRVVISHAFCLGGIEPDYCGRLIEMLLENDIAIMSHGPSGNRPFPPVKQLYEAGVRMACGNDGIRDAWGPLNMPDMLLRGFLLAYRNNFRRDDEIEMVIDIITRSNAQVIGAADYGLEPGMSADFVLVDGETHVQAVVDRPARHLVVKSGRITARNGECLV